MQTHVFQDIEPFEIVNGYHARMIHTDNLTIAQVHVEAGAPMPEHSHFHEQVTTLLEGQFEMSVGGETRLLVPGQAVVIPRNVPHSGRALTDCLILDVFQPVREDFRAKKVAYGNSASDD